MNRNALNTVVLGSGVQLPNKFWTAVEAITVSVADGFAILVGGASGATQSIVVSASAAFTHMVSFASEQAVQLTDSTAFTRVQKLVSAVQVAVSGAANPAVGLAKFLVSTITTGVVAGAVFTRQRVGTAAQSVIAGATASFGRLAALVAAQQVRANTASSFTTFGEYAPAERAMIVPQEDRDAEVV